MKKDSVDRDISIRINKMEKIYITYKLRIFIFNPRNLEDSGIKTTENLSK